jgi:hypothetical protein
MNTSVLQEFRRENIRKNSPHVKEYIQGSFDVLTVKQPYATMLVLGVKKYEYRKYRLPDCFVGKPILIHAGAQPLQAKVKVSEDLYNFYLDLAERKNLFKCIIGAVVFGESELSDAPFFTGYRWPVKECLLFTQEVRDIRGNQKIWKLKLSSPISTE